jgi:ABC-type sugar transport system ATPase subunit
MADEFILKTRGLTKHYGGVHALEGADFQIAPGDNGAGKSTIVRQIAGAEQPTSGQIFFDGIEQRCANPLHARKVGIETVFQNLALAHQRIDIAQDGQRAKGFPDALDGEQEIMQRHPGPHRARAILRPSWKA